MRRRAIGVWTLYDVLSRGGQGPLAQCTHRPDDRTLFGAVRGCGVSVLVLGVDPGLSGAIAGLSNDGALEFVSDLPIVRDLKLAWVDGNALQGTLQNALGGRTGRAIVERVSSMPGQGIASSFQLGVGFGSILSLLQAMRISIEFVTPAVWKKSYGLGKDKRASLHKARLLYPNAELHIARHSR
jgi:crossover junction endodeoxyribonuclease RuvC